MTLVVPLITLALLASGAGPGAGAPHPPGPPDPVPVAHSHSSTVDIATVHHEQRRDPYLPTPPQPPGPKHPGDVVFGAFHSVQVNTDADGFNTVGDAANEPSIAVDPNDRDRIAIGWRQFDNVNSNFRQAGVAYSQDGGQTWTFPGVLQPGQFRSDPILDADADGIFHYYSLSTLTSAEFFKSSDGGVTWTGPVPAFGGDKAWITIDRTGGIGRGNVYADWNLSFSCCNGDFTRSTDGAQTFLQPIAVPFSPIWGTLSVGPDGELYESGVGVIVVKSSNAQDPSTTPTFDTTTFVDLGGFTVGSQGPNPGGLLGQVWIATDHSAGPTRGNVYLLASVRPPGLDPLDVMFARSTDGALTWSAPVRVNDDPDDADAWQWFGTMSVAPDGRIDVFWNDTRNTGVDNLCQLFYAFSTDAGVTWSENVPVTPVWDSHIGFPQQNKIGDYYHSVSDNDGVNLAYAATFNGEQDVYFLRIAHTIGNSDADGDGDTDLADYTAFGNCVTGDHTLPGFIPPADGCDDFDFDLDTDVDLVDFGTVQDRFTGDCGLVITASPDDAFACLLGTATFEVQALGTDLSYIWRHDGIQIDGATGPTLVIDPVGPQAAGLYSAVVSGGCVVAVSDSAQLFVATAPAITTQPQNVSVCLGDPAEFTAEAAGVQPLIYQWQHDGQDIPGAVDQTLVIESVTLEDRGQYRCLVRDDCGQTTASRAAELVIADALIQIQPVGAQLCVGDTLFMFVGATGFPDYQWFKNGLPIPGAQQPFLAIPSVTNGDAGLYHIVLTNDCNTTASDDALVTVACGGSCPPCAPPP